MPVPGQPTDEEIIDACRFFQNHASWMLAGRAAPHDPNREEPLVEWADPKEKFSMLPHRMSSLLVSVLPALPQVESDAKGEAALKFLGALQDCRDQICYLLPPPHTMDQLFTDPAARVLAAQHADVLDQLRKRLNLVLGFKEDAMPTRPGVVWTR